ncbi:MAG: 50S ribosomal protein L6 [candidate division Zixibacteria bacterium]|nr:50S ribosomal protein L6 [candidate division Zixibacteria bacterium]
MSRVGKLPIPIPDKAKVDIKGQKIDLSGPKGSLSMNMHPDISATVKDNEILVARPSDQKRHRALHGLTRALINNMMVGVTEGYKRELQIIGVGYRAEVKGHNLILNLGYSHPIVFTPPEGVTIEVLRKENKVILNGIDKQMVGQCAAKIRSLRKPEPYKGKGIRYVGEYVRSKVGKKAGA